MTGEGEFMFRNGIGEGWERGREGHGRGGYVADLVALRHESRILGQWSSPVSGSRKS